MYRLETGCLLLLEGIQSIRERPTHPRAHGSSSLFLTIWFAGQPSAWSHQPCTWFAHEIMFVQVRIVVERERARATKVVLKRASSAKNQVDRPFLHVPPASLADRLRRKMLTCQVLRQRMPVSTSGLLPLHHRHRRHHRYRLCARHSAFVLFQEYGYFRVEF